MSTKLENIIAEQLSRNVPGDITAMAAHIRQSFPDNTVVAVLAYGSCLRGVSTDESLIDFYIITKNFKDVSTSTLSALACRILPPNVYYAQTTIDGRQLRAKYAVLDIKVFNNWLSAKTANPYFWARFAQPVSLVWSNDPAVIISAIKTAITTSLANVQPADNPIDTWTRLLGETYQTELRAEGPTRAGEIVERNSDWYEAITKAAPKQQFSNPNWAARRIQGKLLSVARLIKAAFTFTGGADYLAWKISRHSGQQITLTNWQRRHPILASIRLLPKLLKKGAVR